MKYFVMLCDGMADERDERGLTPMTEAKKPIMDGLASRGTVGLVRTVPFGMKPGSDVANLGAMGFETEKCYTGRSPLEALSIGVEMAEGDVTYRANLVTISDDLPFEEKIMVDYSSGEITTKESTELINYLKEYFDSEELSLFPGISYRHCLRRHNAKTGASLTPPHDISDKKIGAYLPSGEYGAQYTEMIKRSYELLRNHPVNQNRMRQGKNPANSLWFWGEGTKPALPDFKERTGLKAAVISAVDLIKGIAIGSGMEVIEVEGATGNIDTNFDGKAAAAIEALKISDYVYVHVEAPDECGHQGNRAQKTRSIELIDEKILAPVISYLNQSGEEYSVLVMPDHPTPITKKTHTSDPVPFAIYDSTSVKEGAAVCFNELLAENSGLTLQSGVELFRLFVK